MDPRPILGPVSAAAARKVESMLAPSRETVRPLLDAAEARLGPGAVAEAQRLVDLANAFAAKTAGADAYLAHPFRVATFTTLLSERPGLETLRIAVLHNAYEVFGLNETALVADAGLSAREAHAIRLLTIDRAKESDPSYLSVFYGRIEAHGAELALVRVLDKLDNLLGLELLDDGAIKTLYVDLAEAFVGPIAQRLCPDLGAYFSEVVGHMRGLGCNDSLRQKYVALTGAA